MRSTFVRSLAVAFVVAASACTGADTVAPAPKASLRTPGVVRALDQAPDSAALTASRTIEGYQWVPCAANGAGEYVRTSGEIRYRAHRIQDANGVYHLNINSNTSQLTGVGETTGDTYRGSQTERVIARGVGYDGFQSLRIAEDVHFVALGGGADFTIQYDTHMEVDATGTLVLWVESQRTSCK